MAAARRVAITMVHLPRLYARQIRAIPKEPLQTNAFGYQPAKHSPGEYLNKKIPVGRTVH